MEDLIKRIGLRRIKKRWHAYPNVYEAYKQVVLYEDPQLLITDDGIDPYISKKFNGTQNINAWRKNGEKGKPSIEIVHSLKGDPAKDILKDDNDIRMIEADTLQDIEEVYKQIILNILQSEGTQLSKDIFNQLVEAKMENIIPRIKAFYKSGYDTPQIIYEDEYGLLEDVFVFAKNVKDKKMQSIYFDEINVILNDIRGDCEDRIRNEILPYNINVDEHVIKELVEIKMADVKSCLISCYMLQVNESMNEIMRLRNKWSIKTRINIPSIFRDSDEFKYLLEESSGEIISLDTYSTGFVNPHLFDFMSDGTSTVILSEWTINNDNFIDDLKASGKKLKLNMDSISDICLFFTYLMWGPLDPYNGHIIYSDIRPLIEIKRNNNNGIFSQPVDIKLNYTSTRISADKARELTKIIVDLQKTLGRTVSVRTLGKGTTIMNKVPKIVIQWMYYARERDKKTYNQIYGMLNDKFNLFKWGIDDKRQIAYLVREYKEFVVAGFYRDIYCDDKDWLEKRIKELAIH